VVTEVAHGGHPGADLLQQRPTDDQRAFGVGPVSVEGEGVGFSPGHQVHVRVDESRQDHGVRMVDHRPVLRQRRIVRPNRDDAVTLHMDLHTTGQEPLPVERVAGPDHEGCPHAQTVAHPNGSSIWRMRTVAGVPGTRLVPTGSGAFRRRA
jgi:hypothetical protein